MYFAVDSEFSSGSVEGECRLLLLSLVVVPVLAVVVSNEVSR